MMRTTKYINSISDIFLLQCNIAKNIGRSDQHTYEKASIQYTVNILKKNGFPVIKVMKPFKYTRPIVIGKK